MLNNFKLDNFFSVYEKESFSIVNVFFYSLSFFCVFSLIIHSSVISIRSDVFNYYMKNNFIKVEQLDFQVRKSLELSQEGEYIPCSDEDLVRLRELKRTYLFVDDLGRVSDNKIICTAQDGVLDKGIELPLSGAVTLNEVQYWNSQTNIVLNDKNKPVITYKDAVLFVSPAYLYLTKNGYFNVKGLGGVTYIKGDGRYVYSYFGEVLPKQIDAVISHKNTYLDWLPIPNRFITKSQCNSLYNTCITVADFNLGFYGVGLRNNIFVFVFLIFLSCVIGILIDDMRVGPRAFVRKLKRNIYNNNIYPVYQPQINIDTNKVVGVESLARWNDPELGFISPEIFIGVAEDYALIESLTKKLIVRIFNELNETLETHETFTVSINISTDLLTSDSFIEFLLETTSKYKFNPNQVVLEVTERSASNQERMASFAQKLKLQGYLVSIDDFGTGVSNLAWLSTLDPNEIKVDKSFTQAIETETVNSISLEGIFSMLDHLQVKVVFEGIETEEQRDYIHKRVPGSIGQGWLFARPKLIDDLKIYLETMDH